MFKLQKRDKKNYKMITHLFIIPYRNREPEMKLFNAKMPLILDKQLGSDKYEIWYITQTDERLFNRGALLNIGFLEMKRKYANNDRWKNIQLIFHDVDIYLEKMGILNYNTERGKVRHPYGDLRPQWGGILGCLCIIYADDYNKTKGYPNFFGWGGEDVALSLRCQAQKIIIDEHDFILRRSHPYIIDPISHITPKEIAFTQVCDKRNLREVFFKENQKCPINGFHNLHYEIIRDKMIDNINKIKMLDVKFEILC